MPGGIHPPLSVIASWPKPSPNPERRGWDAFVLMIVLYTLCLVVVGMRLQARLFMYRNAGLDDACIVIAMIFLLPLAISIAGATRFWGFDKHAWDLTPDESKLTRKIVLIIESVYLFATGFTKISILLFYRRMSGGTISPVFHWMVRIAIAFVVLSTLAFQMALMLSCRPLSAFWNQVDIYWIVSHKEGVNYECYEEGAENISNTAISMLQDLAACFMPIVLFWTLQLPFRQKVALAAIFFVGFFTCIAGLIRGIYVYRIFYTTYDVTWVANRAWLWLGIESHLGVICASAPALKVYFKRYFSSTQITYSLSHFRSGPSTGTRGNRTGTFRTSDEKSVVGTTEVYYNYSGQSTNHSPNHLGSMQDIDLEQLGSRGGIAVTCDIEIASEHEFSMPSSPMSPKDMLIHGYTQSTRGFTPASHALSLNTVNVATQTQIAPWVEDTTDLGLNRTKFPYEDHKP